MKTTFSMGEGVFAVGRGTYKWLCLAGLTTAMTGCVPADRTGTDDSAEVDSGEDSGLADGAEDSVGVGAEALSSPGFSTFVGGSGHEDALKPAVDAAGNVYVAGTMPVAGKDRDILVAKYSPAGALLFAVTFGGTGAEDVRDIAVDAAGNTYVLAKTASYGATKQILVAKLNAAGNAILYYSRFGGSGSDQPWGLAIDGSGNAYVTGETLSTDFPTTPGALQLTRRAGSDGFVTKLSAAGNTLLYSTYLGGDGYEGGCDIAVDAYGYAYVVGGTQPPASGAPFPTTMGAYRTIPAGSYDVFVTELTPSGSSMFYSTFVGGSKYDQAWGIAVDSSYNAYVTGWSTSADFPTTAGAFRSKSFDAEIYALKLNAWGTALVYSTFTGAAGGYTSSITVSGSWNAYVTGTTYSGTFPVTAGAFQTQFGGNVDGFLLELNPGGSAALYGTYFGSTGADAALGVAVDASGNAYVTGTTDSPTFPVLGAAQPTYGGNGDGFLVKLNGP